MRNNEQINPSIFEYDEIYDEIKKRPQNNSKNKQRQHSRSREKDRPQRQSSKYINKMKKISEKRSKDHQRAIEKKMLRDNRKLGISESEIFVTESYLEKIEEQKAAKIKEKQQEEYDLKHSATNSKNSMLDFTRRMLDQEARRKGAKEKARELEALGVMATIRETNDKQKHSNRLSQRVE